MSLVLTENINEGISGYPYDFPEIDLETYPYYIPEVNLEAYPYYFSQSELGELGFRIGLPKIKWGLPRIKIGKFHWKMTPKQAAIAAGVATLAIPGVGTAVAGAVGSAAGAIAKGIKTAAPAVVKAAKTVIKHAGKAGGAIVKEAQKQKLFETAAKSAIQKVTEKKSQTQIKAQSIKPQAMSPQAEDNKMLWIVAGVGLLGLVLIFIFNRRKKR